MVTCSLEQGYQRALDPCSELPEPLKLPFVRVSKHEGQQQGLLPYACFLLLLDRQESQTLRKPVTSWTYIRTGRNQILPRLTRVSPPLLGPLQ